MTPVAEQLAEYRANLTRMHGAIPSTSGAFAQLHRAASAPGALSASVKELMALAVAIATGCEGCLVWHLDAALKAGATDAEVHDAVGVAVLMAGGPGTYYGSKAIAALAELTA